VFDDAWDLGEKVTNGPGRVDIDDGMSEVLMILVFV
jgi:hypothetical protein